MSYSYLRHSVGLLDLSRRGRLCLTGRDRIAFLHGQLTNSVKPLQPGQGCYAALVDHKGKLQADLNLFVLPDECLLDLEPGCSAAVQKRLEQFIVAEEVQVLDAAPHFNLITAQGPRAAEVALALAQDTPLPGSSHHFITMPHPAWGEISIMNLPRGTSAGFDIYMPVAAFQAVSEVLEAAARNAEGGWTDEASLETCRIESGLPRFGPDGDMDSSNLAPEAGLESRAIRYDKGCYIGQEVIARIRTYGQVAKSLRGLLLDPALTDLPARGAPLWREGKNVGYTTTTTQSPALQRPIALGYVRKEWKAAGTRLELRQGNQSSPVEVVDLPPVPLP